MSCAFAPWEAPLWYEIPGFPGYYVTKDGVVKGKRKILNAQLNLNGYLTVYPYINGKKFSLPVHKAVALAFLGKPSISLCVAHNNGNKADNRLENLRLASPKENAADKIAHGTIARGEGHGKSVLSEKMVSDIFCDPRPYTEIAKEYGVSPNAVTCICKGYTWGHLTKSMTPPVRRKRKPYVFTSPSRSSYKSPSRHIEACDKETEAL